jgi:hypothetical protein
MNRATSKSKFLSVKLRSVQFLPVFRSLVAFVLAFGSASLAPVAAQSVTPLPTAETVLLGRFAQGPLNVPQWVGPAGFETTFGSTNPAAWPAEVQARQFFANGGTSLHVIRIAATGSLFNVLTGDSNALTGLYAVQPLSDVRLLIAPELSLLSAGEFVAAFASFRAFLDAPGIFFILDPPPGLSTTAAMTNWAGTALPGNAPNCAIYYPYLQIQLNGSNLTVPASGTMAAIYAQNAAGYGIWHAPAGTSFPLSAVTMSPVLVASESDLLTAQNINPIRIFPGSGIVPWGARTLDLQNGDNRYIPVVCTREWIAASVQRSLAFAATNDNAEPLWSQIRTVTANFLHSLWLQGALPGSTPSDAYFVRCDSSTTTANDLAMHRVNLLYGIALLKAGEFLYTTLTMPTYDPQRQAPRPTLSALAVPGNLQFAYPTEPGFNYILESASDPASGPWTSVGDTVVGDGAWRRPAIATTESQAFFRLRITSSR